MNSRTSGITLREWDRRYLELVAAGMSEPPYGGPLRRHLNDGDYRLESLRYDDSAASLRLWNFLLTEEERLHQARAEGKKIVGAMKDLGTVPVMAYSLPELAAFYPDGAWWIPCVMEMSTNLLQIADSMGIDESFCPVRAMIGAFTTGNHFPIPDLLTCSVGATCDDFSAIAQRLEGLGYPIHWWDVPCRRSPSADEEAVLLPGGFRAPASQVEFVRTELERLRGLLGELAGREIDDEALSRGIRAANGVRAVLRELRRIAYTAEVSPLPALEMQIAEMLAIHFCSDRDECLLVLQDLLDEARGRVSAGRGTLAPDAVRVFWVNPVADIRMMNLLEDCGGRVCGTDYLFAHAIDAIPEDLPPMEALARMALADPMVGSAADRARRVIEEMRAFGSEALLISRIPGASHCATEGAIIREMVNAELGVPSIEVEVPPVIDAMAAALSTRMEALVETVVQRRKR